MPADRDDSTNPRIAPARRYQRWPQCYTDFVEAENSMGFHADQESARVLGRAIDFAWKDTIAILGGDLPPTDPALDPPPSQTVTPCRLHRPPVATAAPRTPPRPGRAPGG